MPEPLSPLEQRVYHYMIDFLAEHTYQPSIREIAKQFRIKSTKTVSDVLHGLARKGFIERDPSRSRGVRIVGLPTAIPVGAQPVPYYGRVAAGEPALIPEHRAGFITTDRRFLPSAECFFLKVQGESMIGRGILDGDFVIVNPTGIPEEGDIVAARIGEEATVKTLRRRDGTTVLEPANPAEREIVIAPGTDFGILGVVSGVFRSSFDQSLVPQAPEGTA